MSDASQISNSQPWWRGAVIYQLYPRSFFDSNGDGIGDLPGILAKLDYISSLGVDALWISPFFKSPMKDYGYDVADYRTVDPMFGSNEDFEQLIGAAHERGLKVMVDMVLAHTSDQHPWFQESRQSRTNPKADWYVWVDPRPDGSPPNNWLSVFGGPSWKWEPRRRQYYLHHFLEVQPNLDWHNPQVVEAMLGEVEFWLERGVDGLRLDAITTLLHDPQLRDNPPASAEGSGEGMATRDMPHTYQEHRYDRDHPDIMERFAQLRVLVDRYPDRFMLGEIADVDSIIATARYTQGDSALHTGYTFQMIKDQFGVELMRRVIGRFEDELGSGWATHAFGNHDCKRVVSRWGTLPHLEGDRAGLAKMLMACLLSLRGSICVYQGEELGLTEADLPLEALRDPWGIDFYPVFKGRDGCRTPMPWSHDPQRGGFTTATPWLPVWHEHLALCVERQEADPDSVLNAYRRFLAWRKQHPALITGDKLLLDTPEPIYAFERHHPDERLLCVFNLSNGPVEMPMTRGWQPITGHGFEAAFDDRTLSLPPFGVFFATAS
ncbi:MAG: alpha-glucosidase family protein [Candidatus Competibacteraceae bacterium]|nr:alpha-glucosidase family protein [Candidatus Competibacteraceae bacterium]